MTKILNIRGTNGSGKTTLTKRFVYGPPIQITKYADKRGKEWPGLYHYNEETGVAVIGEYKGEQCGGCDRIKTQDGVQHIILEMLKLKPKAIIFEGLLVSGLYGRYKTFDDTLSALGHSYNWCFLTPELQTCMERVQKRSGRVYEAEGLAKLEANVRKKRDAVIQVRAKALADGLRVWDLPTASVDDAEAQVRNLLEIHTPAGSA